MVTVSESILNYATNLLEGTPLTAKELLHLGKRAAVDQALSRLARRGSLIHAGCGIYMRPVETRFGVRPPAPAKAIEAIARMKGETVVRHGAVAANALGLTSQVPVREVYLTSGPSRQLKFGAQVVEMRHAASRQLVLAGRRSGDVIRALQWLGPEYGAAAIQTLKSELPQADLEEVSAIRGGLPGWMAQQFSPMAVECPATPS